MSAEDAVSPTSTSSQATAATASRHARMPLQRQPTFGLYELSAEDTTAMGIPTLYEETSCEHKTEFPWDVAHKPEIKSTVLGTPCTDSVNKLKKKLTRTDSSVLVVSTNGQEDGVGVAGPRGKPPPSPPILVHNVQDGDAKRGGATRQNTVGSGSGISARHLQQQLARHQNHSGHAAASQQPGNLSTNNYSSCPNLVDGADFRAKAAIRPSRSSEGRLCKTAPSPSRSARTSPSLLTVPNFFTTSYTHSKPINRAVEKVKVGRRTSAPIACGAMERHQSLDSSSSSEGSDSLSPGEASLPPVTTDGGAERRHYRHSAPELVGDPTELTELQEMRERCPLTKSLSDTPCKTSGLPQELAARTEPRISQILDFLCIGNLESAHNERLLCKKHISSVLDLSNVQPEEVPTSRKNIAPCPCGSMQKHMRAVLRLTMCESDLVEVKSHFPKINKFIEGTRTNKKKVLVYCDSKNNNLSVLVCAQYLMHHRNMNFRKAYSQIMKGRSDIELNPAYNALLQSLENQIYPEEQEEEEEEDVLVTQQEPVKTLRRGSSGLLPREAWTDEASNI